MGRAGNERRISAVHEARSGGPSGYTPAIQQRESGRHGPLRSPSRRESEGHGQDDEEVADRPVRRRSQACKEGDSEEGPGQEERRPRRQPPSRPPRTSSDSFDQKFLDEQRAALIEERSRYVQSAETLKAEADALVEGREPGDVQFDEESGEGDTLAVERERDLALSAHARAAVEEIDAALARLDAGTYGICKASGKPIPKERLRAIPWAAERVEYKAGGFGITR